MNIEKDFLENLELAKEENPLMTLDEQLNLAVLWTVEQSTGLINRYRAYYKDRHDDAVNKAFFG